MNADPARCASQELRSRSVVNSYTEWGALEEVILGSHYNATVGSLDLSMELLFHDNLQRARRRHPGYVFTIKKKYIEEREEDTARLADLLRSRGIVVRRPETLPDVRPFRTPYWEGITKACDNPRDRVLVVGDRLIETPACVRNRLFETDLLKPILYDYFRSGAQWINAPLPMMLDASFDQRELDGGLEPPRTPEIMFDAAQCLRFGRDIVMNVSNANHELGYQWLQRVLGEPYRIHKVSVTDNHIDGAFVPLRPGKILISDRMLGKTHLLPEPLRSWDVIHMTDEDRGKYEDDDLLLASSRISVNVLSLDEVDVVVNEQALKTIHALEQHGFNPIPVRFRHSRIFGGGLHCVSVDVRRNENLEDYFH